MVRRFASLGLVAWGIAALLFVAPAAAQTPPNVNYAGCQAFVSDVTVEPGQTITVSGSGANSGDTVTAVFDQLIATGIAGPEGNFSFPATIAASAEPGARTLTVTCGVGGGAARITITVSGGNAPVTTFGAGNGSLPRTGSNIVIPLVKFGIALIAAGGLILAASRRRRWAQQATLTD